MKQILEEKIEDTRAKCKEKLQLYQNSTESNTLEYRQFLHRDASLSNQVERKLRQVERMQASIQHWKLKIAQNRQECEERNAQLRTEKDHIAKHFQELKTKMNLFRSEEKKRLADLTQNARNCIKSLKDQLALAEKIVKTAELCRKFETEREKVLPFYLSRDLLNEFEEGELDFGDEDLKEEIRKELSDIGIDEWLQKYLKDQIKKEMFNSKFNMSKIQESWLKIMRSAKTKQLKKQVEIISQNHERDVDRKDAILQMLDRDLDEAEEQHQVAVRSHLLNVDRLLEIQQSRLLALQDEFKRDVATLTEEFRIEREQIQEKHALEKRELTLIVEQVERDEKNREQADITDHQSQFEMIRNRNIE